MAWDPSDPSTLLLPTNTEDGGFRFDCFLADDGVGCNDYETSALMKLLDGHENYYFGDDNDDENTKKKKRKRGEWSTLKSLSKSYRNAIRECLMGWEESIIKKVEAEEVNNIMTEDATNEDDNLELLKLVYAVTHLSEVYLLLPPPLGGGEYEDMTTMQGAVTADTVRYLRFHHMPDPYASEEVEQMLGSTQPDQFDSELYWNLVRTFVLWGMLEEAWAVLSRHSSCQQCFRSDVQILDEYHDAILQEDRDGFLALRDVLLSAPLPGGRNDENDSGLDSGKSDSEDGDDQAAAGETFLSGVPRSAYKLWETCGSTTSSTEGGISSDFPVEYNPNAAKAAHSAWTKYVSSLAPLADLTRRIPQLQSILVILRGNLQNVVFESWSEALCAELLYLRPALRPNDLHIRTARIMEKFGVSADSGFDGVILDVMKGNAGRVVEVLHDLGGGSGAALPATMTALLTNLFTEAELVSNPDVNPDSLNIQTELMLVASNAILSSLSESQQDVGVRLSTRLLLPYARPDGDVRVTATLAETLQRHAPQSDAETKQLLGLCRPLIERKSIRILDGCVGLCLARYRYYMADQRPGGAIHWMLKGVELERLIYSTKTTSDNDDSNLSVSDWQHVLASGCCGKFIVADCRKTSKALLRGLLDKSSNDLSRIFQTAKEMVASIREDEIYARTIPEVKLLFHVHDIGCAYVENKGNESVASSIVACLEEITDIDDDGVVSVLAHPSMYKDLLSLAQVILAQDEDRYEAGGSDEMFKSSFDVNGIHILLRRFTQIVLEEGKDTESTRESRLALCTGLQRAFVSENAHLATNRFADLSGFVSVNGIRSTKLASCSHEEQELTVELMLEPSM